jgi:hypothetical protein
MTRRAPLLRFLALLWAGLQFAMPALGSLADARFAAAAGDPVSHVESTSSASCPAVHAPDCAVCRYLSGATPVPENAAAVNIDAEQAGAQARTRCAVAHVAIILPDGRAPPAL